MMQLLLSFLQWHLTPCAISLLSSFCLSPLPFLFFSFSSSSFRHRTTHQTTPAGTAPQLLTVPGPVVTVHLFPVWGEHHHCTPSPPVDHGCLPEESASPARCMIVHQSNILDNVKNLLEFAETLQLIDSVSRLAASSGFVRGQGVRGEELGLS